MSKTSKFKTEKSSGKKGFKHINRRKQRRNKNIMLFNLEKLTEIEPFMDEIVEFEKIQKTPQISNI